LASPSDRCPRIKQGNRIKGMLLQQSRDFIQEGLQRGTPDL
jgi:hypothetical protein